MSARSTASERASARRFAPYAALIPICLGVFVAADDQTVVVTVLPQIMTYMKVDVVKDVDQASWIITGYLLGYVAAMPLIGRVSDVLGHRRAYVALHPAVHGRVRRRRANVRVVVAGRNARVAGRGRGRAGAYLNRHRGRPVPAGASRAAAGHRGRRGRGGRRDRAAVGRADNALPRLAVDILDKHPSVPAHPGLAVLVGAAKPVVPRAHRLRRRRAAGRGPGRGDARPFAHRRAGHADGGVPGGVRARARAVRAAAAARRIPAHTAAECSRARQSARPT